MRLRVGLTGGIGSGKTEVGRIFVACGALLVDADVLAREALAPGSPGLRRVAERFPEVVRDGALDRAALATIVFGDPEARAFLNGVVHPAVRARATELEAAAAADGIVVHDIPLLFETGGGGGFDATVLVVAPLEERIARVTTRSGFSRDDIERRMAAQIDPDLARRQATFVIDNDASLEALGARARAVYAALEALPGRSETSAGSPM